MPVSGAAEKDYDPTSLSADEDPATMGSIKTSEITISFAASLTSGFFARLPFHPFDTIKAKLQIQTIGGGTTNASVFANPHAHSTLSQTMGRLPLVGRVLVGWRPDLAPHGLYTSTYSALINTLKYEGLIGLYRGIVTTSLGAVPATCLYYTTYETSREAYAGMKLLQHRPMLTNFLGGLTAELISCIFWVPVDVIKERCQTQSIAPVSQRYTGPIDAVIKILKREGVRGTYKAYGATVLSFGPQSGIQLSLHEKFKEAAVAVYGVKTAADLPGFTFGLTGAVAGGIAAFLTTPLDVVKLRMQVSRGPMDVNFNYKNLAHGFYRLVTEEGIAGMYRGAGARVLFFMPSTGMGLLLYENCKRLWRFMLD